MNVARSTFMRKGYLLTALSVAVLLAASSGTAWAQTIGFSTSRGTLQEGASIAANTEDPLTISITRSGNFDADDGNSETDDDATFEAWAPNQGHVVIEAVEYDGSPNTNDLPFTFKMRSGDSTAQPAVTIGSPFSFGAEAARSDGIATRIELTIENTAEDDDDWNEEKLVLKVVADPDLITHLGENKVSYRTQELTVTVVDNEPMPVLKFTPGSIQLAKDNMQPVTVAVGTGTGGTGMLPTDMRTALNGLGSGKNVVLSVSPASAVGDLIEITYTDGGAKPSPDGSGGYIVGTIGSIVAANNADADGIGLNIKALRVSGFRDEMISLTLADGRREAEQEDDGGGITSSAPATVTILSGEETPTVTFSKATLELDEGDSETVHLLADSDQGDQVGSATVRVSGDALISLRQDGSPISGGNVSFGGSANAELTIVSLSDPDLEDGDESTATVTITNAGGANIGDPRAVTVTVVGSTAVPVFPLFAQLLLALLLMVGGARLYRRRQG